MNTNLLAQVDIGKEWILNPTQTITGASQFQTPGALISIILKNVYVIAGILLFALMILGGFSFIQGSGEKDPKKTGKGMKVIIAALKGFLIIFASYWIIQIIEIITGMKILNPVP